MARGGKREGSGRPRNRLNQKTIQRNILLARKAAEEELQAAAEAGDKAKALEAARKAGMKMGKEILAEFANALAARAAYYQPVPTNPNANEDKFLSIAELAVYAAEKLAPFESPRLAAVMVGTAQTKRIEVVGGLPEPKVIDGSVERNNPGDAPDLPRVAGPSVPAAG